MIEFQWKETTIDDVNAIQLTKMGGGFTDGKLLLEMQPEWLVLQYREIIKDQPHIVGLWNDVVREKPVALTSEVKRIVREHSP